jgi:nucleoside-diphosphate-sugar epimerase
MKFLIFGMGYTARALLDAWPADWPRDIVVTTRSRDKADALTIDGVTTRVFPGDDLAADLARASHVLVTAGPQEGRDPVLAHLRDAFAEAPHLEWVGYLSTTGVYGDHAGGWVDEDTPLTPSTERGVPAWRRRAEWQALRRDHGLPLHIFRLAGIYGPGRRPFAKVRAGTARRIVKPGQVFSRCHVEDIAQVLIASIRHPDPGGSTTSATTIPPHRRTSSLLPQRFSTCRRRPRSRSRRPISAPWPAVSTPKANGSGTTASSGSSA